VNAVITLMINMALQDKHPVNTERFFNHFFQAKKASQQAAAELGIKWLDTCVRRLLPERIRGDQV
jgi:hypothetical protein